MTTPAEVIREALRDLNALLYAGGHADASKPMVIRGFAALSELTAERDRLEAEGNEWRAAYEESRDHHTAYVDVKAAQIARLTVENERLREALTEIRDGPEWQHGHPTDIARVALSQPPQEGDLPESSKFIASGYGRTWDESGMTPQPPREDKP